MSITTTELMGFQVMLGSVDWYTFSQFLTFTALMLMGLGLGVWLFQLLPSQKLRNFRRLKLDVDHISKELSDIVDEQNVIIGSLNNKYGIEQKRWNLRLSNQESKIEELNVRAGDGVDRSELVTRDNRIKSLQGELNERDRQIKLLRQNTPADLSPRVNELEIALKQRDQQIHNVRIKHQEEVKILNQKVTTTVQPDGNLKARLEELERVLGERDRELMALRAQREQQEKDINELLAERDDELNNLRAESKNRGNMSDRLRDLEHQLSQREREIEELRAGEKRRIVELEDMLGERESNIVALQNDLSEREGFRDQRGRLRELEEELNRARRDSMDQRELENQQSQLQNQHSQLANQLRDRDRDYQALQVRIQEAERDRDTRILEMTNLLKTREDEVNALRGNVPSANELQTRLSELEWQIGEKDAELDGIRVTGGESTQRIEELEYLLWERDSQLEEMRKEQEKIDKGRDEIATRIQELEWSVGERDGELTSVRQEKDNLMTRIRDLEWLLGERDGELDFLRHEKTELDSKMKSAEKSSTRVEKLEVELREKEGELERWWNENEALKNQLRERDGSLETMRREVATSEAAHARTQELEWTISERDTELERLRFEKNELAGRFQTMEFDMERLRERIPSEDLQFRLTELERLIGQRDSEIQSLKGNLSSSYGLEARIRELERLVNEREREVRSLRTEKDALRNQLSTREGDTRLLQVERSTNGDLQTRIQELERMLQENERRDHNSTASLTARLSDLERLLENSIRPIAEQSQQTIRPVEHQPEFRFTLEDGTVVYVKGDERVQFEGRTHRASDLFDSLGDDY